MDGCDINGICDDDDDDNNGNDNRGNAGDHELDQRRKDGSTVQLKIDFPWEAASESTC